MRLSAPMYGSLSTSPTSASGNRQQDKQWSIIGAGSLHSRLLFFAETALQKAGIPLSQQTFDEAGFLEGYGL